MNNIDGKEIPHGFGRKIWKDDEWVLYKDFIIY